MGSLYAKPCCNTALAEVGYQADGKWNKYADELDKINYFNMAPKNGEADWCAIFVCWCIYKNTLNSNGEIDPDKWDAHFFMYQPDSGENLAAGCGYQADYYMQNDAWDSDCKYAKCGDQVFFRNYSHTGIVVDWDDKGIYTVEGNAGGGKVLKRFYEYGDPDIDGFGHPRYDGYEMENHDNDIPSEPKEDTQVPIPYTTYTVSVGSQLNIRSTPEVKLDNKIGELYDGAIVRVFEIEDGWARIGENMWVCMDYLE